MTSGSIGEVKVTLLEVAEVIHEWDERFGLTSEEQEDAGQGFEFMIRMGGGGFNYPKYYYELQDDIKNCECKDLEKKITEIQKENTGKPEKDQTLYYIGYTSIIDSAYLRRTLPKSRAWKTGFVKCNTWFATIADGITENSLTEKFRKNDPNCVNKKAGNMKTQGYLYVLMGTLKSPKRNREDVEEYLLETAEKMSE